MFMGNQLQKIRTKKMHAQSGLCYYCRQPMCGGNQDNFARRFRITSRQALLLRCTAEHLDARCTGGQDSPQNVVAACYFCNSNRHRSKKPLDPFLYAKKATTRLRSGRWHGIFIFPL
ncbi:HNH endonuclease [Parasphingorhabdus sp. JC815]|uniref:HNH endonuclease n=1 Tax=Parasphingorhabdus sp. JC815 TaxID=3232140 RepID=UPI0034598872